MKTRVELQYLFIQAGGGTVVFATGSRPGLLLQYLNISCFCPKSYGDQEDSGEAEEQKTSGLAGSQSFLSVFEPFSCWYQPLLITGSFEHRAGNKPLLGVRLLAAAVP